MYSITNPFWTHTYISFSNSRIQMYIYSNHFPFIFFIHPDNLTFPLKLHQRYYINLKSKESFTRTHN